MAILVLVTGAFIGVGGPAFAAVEPARPVGLLLAAKQPALVLADSPAPPQPIDVTPDWHDMPAKDRIMDLLDTLSRIAEVCCVAVAIIGGAALGVGRVSGSAPQANRGMGMLLGGGAGAIVIVYAPDLIAWLAK
ncbi:hypothetical protein [Frankia sp. AgB32]|uniref:hypothetical protein n=1 Tax=Frankia sp. AgB32 TaxID=631119 RepID=UPI00200C7E49|nr:hypothetical protein [Frankia sp. AgB32]MCK9895031.1 hypothetical protein [Frankia sp. AgB32]